MERNDGFIFILLVKSGLTIPAVRNKCGRDREFFKKVDIFVHLLYEIRFFLGHHVLFSEGNTKTYVTFCFEAMTIDASPSDVA